MTLILHNMQLQQWDEVLKHVDAMEKLAVDKPGVRWLRSLLFITLRRHEEARQRLLSEARKLAAQPQTDDIYLADFLMLHVQSIASGPELLEALNILKPVYERHPQELRVMPRWQSYLLSAYDSLGRTEESLAIRKQLAEESPWDVSLQTDYARRLAQASEVEAAVAWLQQQLKRPEHNSPEHLGSAAESLRSALADLLQAQAKWNELLEFTAAWIALKPESSGAYQRHLAALIYKDQLENANTLAEKWLREGQREGKLTADEKARLDTAIYFAQGSAYNLSFHRPDPRWQGPLEAAGRVFLRRPEQLPTVQSILNYQLMETDAGDRLRGFSLTLLQTETATLTSEQINYMVGVALTGRLEVAEPFAGRRQLQAAEVPAEVWGKIAAVIKERWTRAEDKDEKHRLGDALKAIYADRFPTTALLPFLRERIAAAPPEYKSAGISDLFETLLQQPWSNEVEQESFEWLRQLTESTEPAAILRAQVPALYRLVDALVANRIALEQRKLQDSGEAQKLSRSELLARNIQILNEARAGVASRLLDVAKRDKSPVTPWLNMEAAWLHVQLDKQLAQVAAQCWEILGETPPAATNPDDDENIAPSELQRRFFDRLLQQRAYATLMNLAARRTAQPEAVQRLIKYIDAGVERKGEAAAPGAEKFDLLVALDRPDDLERELRSWIRDDVTTAPWRVMLGILLAERGKLPEAIGLFEAAEKHKLLTAAHFRLLADWYLVSQRREAYERTRVEAFKQLPEHHLANLAYYARERWYRTDRPLPSELDEETLFAFKALFEKSGQPENYLWQLREVYAACRDFRLLAMLPDALLGRTPQQIYPFLQRLRSDVLQELRNEASADEIIARIAKLRRQKRTPTDLRRSTCSRRWWKGNRRRCSTSLDLTSMPR